MSGDANSFEGYMGNTSKGHLFLKKIERPDSGVNILDLRKEAEKIDEGGSMELIPKI